MLRLRRATTTRRFGLVYRGLALSDFAMARLQQGDPNKGIIGAGASHAISPYHLPGRGQYLRVAAFRRE